MNSIVSGASLASAIAIATAVEALPAAEHDPSEGGPADPIFAAIGRWKEALAVENASYDARNAAQEAFRDRYGSLSPSGMPREVGEIFQSVSPDKNVYWFMKTHEQITPLKNHADFGQFVPLFHRTLNDQTNDYDENVAPLDEASDQACSIRIDAAYAVFDTVPTTLAGMRAKIDFAMSVDHVTELFIDGDERVENFLETLYACARLIAQA